MVMSPDNRVPDDPRDAHLLAALRHAPDRDLVPPAELTASILAAAHAAVRATARTPAPGPSALRRLLAWIAQPQVSAAFGTLAVAVLVGLLWSTREPPVGEPQATAPEAPPIAPAASGTALADAAPTPAREASVPPREGGSLAERRRASPPAAASTRAAAPASPAPQTAAKGAGMSADAAAPIADSVTAGAIAAAAPPAGPALSAAQESAARQDMGAARTTAAPQAGLARREAQNLASAPAPSTPSAPFAKAAAPADPLAGFDALLADASTAAAVRWERPPMSGSSAPHGNAQREWWARLRAATQGHWEPLQSAPRDSPWLVAKVDGRDRARLWLDGAALVWTDAGSGRIWRAPVDDAERDALRSAAARW